MPTPLVPCSLNLNNTGDSVKLAFWRLEGDDVGSQISHPCQPVCPGRFFWPGPGEPQQADSGFCAGKFQNASNMAVGASDLSPGYW